jgi:hypothetical protein
LGQQPVQNAGHHDAALVEQQLKLDSSVIVTIGDHHDDVVQACAVMRAVVGRCDAASPAADPGYPIRRG